MERWGGELAETFERDLAAAARRGALVRFLLRSVLDLAVCAVALRVRSLHRARLGRRPAAAGPAPRRRSQETLMNGFRADLVHAARALARRPGFLAIAVATLAIGIGANTAIFSIVDRALLAPLPFPDAERLAVVYNAPRGGGGFAAASDVVYWSLAQSEQPFEAIAAFSPAQVNVGGERDPERLVAAVVTASFFEVVGVTPVLGRGLLAAEDDIGAEPVAVIAHSLWERRFGAAPTVLGEGLVVDQRERRIVGVMPPRFELLWPDVEVWLPLVIDPARFDPNTAKNNNRLLIARTRDDLESAAAWMPSLVERLGAAFPEAVGERQEIRLVPLREHTSGELRPTLLLLLGAVGLVLAIACANVAGLLLVRAADRGRELAVRAALGAGVLRLARVQAAESLLLGLAGAAAGVVLAWTLLQAVRPLAPAGVPIPTLADLDWRMLLFTVALTGATVLVSGATPALAAARRAARGESVGSASGGRVTARGRGALVVVEIALAVVLLVGCGLLVKSLIELGRVAPGFALDDRVVADLSLPARAGEGTPELVLRRVVEEAAALPGVETAGAAQWIPLRGSVNWGFEVEGRTDEDVRVADYNLVTPGAFGALGIPLLAGRGFEWRDLEGAAPPVVVISSSLAHRLFPGEEAVGRRLNFDLGERVWREIVGVVGDVRNRSLAQPPGDLVYFPPVPLPFASPSLMSLVTVTAEHDPESLAGPLRALVRSADPAAPVGAVRSMREVARASLREQRFLGLLLSLFAAAAIALAAIGLYGVLSQTLARRTREIGIRVALGARAPDVLRWVALRAGTLVVGGVALGVLGALALSRTLEASLYGVGARDASTYAAAAGGLVLVAAMAALRPARRATRVDPLVALRDD